MICELCPRRCRAVREETHGTGFCAMPTVPVLARAALHPWEEPCLSGTRGSGTIFFSGCTLGCVFCQNHTISHEHVGKAVSAARLREICEELIAQGAHNINLVSPTPYTLAIREALTPPLPVPVVWNTGGYERVETLRLMEGRVQIYLPDLKYADSTLAERYSGAADYFSVATAAIREMYRQVGDCVIENGLLRRGVIIRHLMLPAAIENTKAVMDWVAREFPSGQVLFSLMAQYTPQEGAEGVLSRRVTKAEYRAALAYMENLGIQNGYTQERDSALSDYTPPFDFTGVG